MHSTVLFYSNETQWSNTEVPHTCSRQS